MQLWYFEIHKQLAAQVDEVGKAQPNDQEMADDSPLDSENALIFSEGILSKRIRNVENDNENELVSSSKRSKKDDVEGWSFCSL